MCFFVVCLVAYYEWCLVTLYANYYQTTTTMATAATADTYLHVDMTTCKEEEEESVLSVFNHPFTFDGWGDYTYKTDNAQRCFYLVV